MRIHTPSLLILLLLVFIANLTADLFITDEEVLEIIGEERAMIQTQ